MTLSGPVSTCCACVLRDHRLLLIKRGHEPGKGNWSFPGGRIELGETILEAAKRETLEETGVEIAPLAVFQVYDWIVRDDAGGITFHYLVHYVHARYLSGEPRARDDAIGVLWAAEWDESCLPAELGSYAGGHVPEGQSAGRSDSPPAR